MDFMEFINTPVGAISMLILGVLIICIWAVIHFSYLYKKEKSVVVKWFNATHAVLTFINDKNIKIYGGVIPNRAWRKAERNTLKEYWDISDVNSLNESIKFLMQYGHRSEYINKGNEGDIGAWDYSRAMSLLSSAYVCAYIGKQEALDRSLEIAKVIQSSYTSWDDFMNSYLKGYEYWSNHTPKGRWQIYENLRKQKNSLYNIPWNLELKREW